MKKVGLLANDAILATILYVLPLLLPGVDNVES